ncbi:GNAT family N-acetyltransferase [Flagellimonas sp.]|uniref:GNAT family N-acetyltransferase n=1 Tax=Flagellimonas sp. TaxID=2058762 RepID=UPI003AB2CF6E
MVALGTKNSKTLGHFPRGAFAEYGNKGTIIGAHQNSKTLLGYVLFSITSSRNTIRIVHLCVDESQRGKGIAKLLLDEVRQRFSLQFKGISLSCREDYFEATKFWKQYGFIPKNRIRSRSKKEHYLIKWWYDFGNHDLFSILNESSGKTKALLDANMIIKLRDNDTNEQTGAQYLMADWLVDEIDYYYAPEIYNEIQRDKNKDRIKKTKSFITQFCEARFKPVLRDSVFKEIQAIVPGNSENDISDKKQLSECIAGGIDYFITTDTNLLDSENQIFDEFGVQILTPTDFILMLDQINNSSNYISTRIAGVNVDYHQIQSKEVLALVDCFLKPQLGEKKHELRDSITSITGNVNESKVKVIKDKDEEKLGFWATVLKKNCLSVPLIRTKDTRIASVLFKQLIFDLVNFAIDNGKSKIEISDSRLNDSEIETLESFGFLFRDGTWTKIALTGIVKSVDILSDKRIPIDFSENSGLIQRWKNDAENFTLSVERLLWPIKFSDLDVPVYIVPIKPFWSGQLFDHFRANLNLFGATPELAWNRENIYYRSVKPISEKAPARILWYASTSTNSGNHNRSKSIVGCSYLDEVHIGMPKVLYQKFKTYGIYEWKDVFNLAKKDVLQNIKALKFSDTEVFDNAVSLRDVNDILLKNGRKKNTFASPVVVDTNIFLEIYERGTKDYYE